MTLSPLADGDPAPVRPDYAAIDVQVVRPTCPFCSRPVASLLAGCEKPGCRSLEIDDDRAYERSLDV